MDRVAMHAHLAGMLAYDGLTAQFHPAYILRCADFASSWRDYETARAENTPGR